MMNREQATIYMYQYSLTQHLKQKADEAFKCDKVLSDNLKREYYIADSECIKLYLFYTAGLGYFQTKMAQTEVSAYEKAVDMVRKYCDPTVEDFRLLYDFCCMKDISSKYFDGELSDYCSKWKE